MWVACFSSATNEVLWANSATESTGEWIYGLDLKAVGDKVYLVGYLAGTTVFGQDTVVSTGSYQGYIAKYDIPTGQLDTVVQIGGAGEEEATSIAVGDDGRLYVSGDFTNSITLAGNTFTSNGGYDLYVTCFDTSLTINYWGATAGGPGTDVARNLVPSTASPVASAYVVGYFQNTGVQFGSTNLSSAGNYDFFVAKVDTSGNWLWARSGGGTAADDAYSIDINTSGDKLYVGGVWNGTMTYDGQSYVSNGSRDGYILYLDTAGAMDTLYQFGGTGFDGIIDLQSVHDDYLVFAGDHSGAWTFADSTFTSNGTADAIVAMIGPDFMEVWGKNIGGGVATGDDFNSVFVGPETRLHCGGFFSGNASAYQSGLIGAGLSDALITNEHFTGIIPDMVFTDLPSGNYLVSLKDNLGDSIGNALDIVNPDSIVITGVVTQATSSVATDGEILVTVSGGTLPYVFTWSNGDSVQSLVGIATGAYTLTVTDTNGCVAQASFFVDTLSTLTLHFVVANVTCEATDNGAIDLSVLGGTPPYTYAWSNGETTEDIANLGAGTYTVTVTDSDTAIQQTVSGSAIVANDPIHPQPIVGPITGAASAESWAEFSYSVPSTMGSQFLWSSAGGDVTATAGNAASILWHAGPDGVVYVQETDVNGCSSTDSMVVSILFVGVDETDGSTGVLLFPNPTTGVLHIRSLVGAEGMMVNVMDMMGKSVMTEELSSVTSQVDLSGVPQGVYTITINAGGRQVSGRVVKF